MQGVGCRVELLYINMQRVRGGLVLKDRIRLYHSHLCLRSIDKKQKNKVQDLVSKV